jgi:predicted Fe-S protein YdhL (DUF1289 family)
LQTAAGRPISPRIRAAGFTQIWEAELLSESDDPESLRRARVERRRRARPGRRREFDTSVPSPCITVCQVDDATGCCIGCYRSIDEIREWPILSADEKRAVLARIAERKAAAGA